MGLFGTLVGMIEIFGTNSPGNSNPEQLAHGISVALYNAAFGILVAIPSMIFYRYFRGKVDCTGHRNGTASIETGGNRATGKGRTDSGTRDRDKQTWQLERAHVLRHSRQEYLSLQEENRSTTIEFPARQAKRRSGKCNLRAVIDVLLGHSHFPHDRYYY